MDIQTELYSKSIEFLPQEGEYLIAHQLDDLMIVYQAFNNQIADFALQHQFFGGNFYSYNRMSWIKPNFLWMMFRSGWGQKDNQERVLGIWIHKNHFETILSQAVSTTFIEGQNNNFEEWRKDLEKKDVRLQWDPDHDPYGNKLKRRAMQLGLKGNTLENFSKNYIHKIEDLTAFVNEQWQFVLKKDLGSLRIPIERIYNNSKS